MYARRIVLLCVSVAVFAVVAALAGGAATKSAWDKANPVLPLPAPPLGIDSTLDELPDPPTPERVRLGRWLFYDARLSADGTILVRPRSSNRSRARATPTRRLRRFRSSAIRPIRRGFRSGARTNMAGPARASASESSITSP